jgi:hypothetical protein
VVANRIQPANIARYIFLDPRAANFFTDWETMANDAAATLRAEAERDPNDRRLFDLVGELSTRSEDFRGRWATRDVALSSSSVETLHHPVVGDLTLTREYLHVPDDPGQAILIYAAEPDSPSAEALSVLASWSATPADESVKTNRASADKTAHAPSPLDPRGKTSPNRRRVTVREAPTDRIDAVRGATRGTNACSDSGSRCDGGARLGRVAHDPNA